MMEISCSRAVVASGDGEGEFRLRTARAGAGRRCRAALPALQPPRVRNANRRHARGSRSGATSTRCRSSDGRCARGRGRSCAAGTPPNEQLRRSGNHSIGPNVQRINQHLAGEIRQRLGRSTGDAASATALSPHRGNAIGRPHWSSVCRRSPVRMRVLVKSRAPEPVASALQYGAQQACAEHHPTRSRLRPLPAQRMICCLDDCRTRMPADRASAQLAGSQRHPR